MLLGFKKFFPWKEPTLFREKILAGVGLLPYKIADGRTFEEAEKMLISLNRIGEFRPYTMKPL